MPRRHVGLRGFRCEVWDEPWPDFSGSRESQDDRQRARDQAWAWWFTELQARAVRQDPDHLDLNDLGFYGPKDLPQMRAERQLQESPRWLRAAVYLANGNRDPAYSHGRALLDAGTVRLWLSALMPYRGGEPKLVDLLFDNLAAAAAAYRVGVDVLPEPAFVLHHGALVGPPSSWAETTDARYGVPLPQPGQATPQAAPFDDLQVVSRTNASEPEGFAWTLDEGLAASNAVGRREGLSFSKVREGTREAGGVTGYQTVSSSRTEGDRPALDLLYEWQVQGQRRDPLRPNLSIRAEVELDPSLSDEGLHAAESERRAVWDQVVDSLVTPASRG